MHTYYFMCIHGSYICAPQCRVGLTTKLYTINPKVETVIELNGILDHITRAWRDKPLSSIFRCFYIRPLQRNLETNIEKRMKDVYDPPHGACTSYSVCSFSRESDVLTYL